MFKINFEGFLDTFPVMLYGMFGVFAVIVLIALVTVLFYKVIPAKKEDKD